ncbi:MAG: hypothetical protein JW974_00755 [Alphaproteobacteria bacterium]|nr:hypothetical protein [Alphaproteobacteria bacterium]MBN2674975.1 hypothetical protein [Alphaproteobacteria bacterium]
MTNERENNSTINLSSADGIPKVSFGTSADTQTKLEPKDYEISGNEFTAYYDGAHKLVFVLDKTLDDRKPNVLLVINPMGDRKWDDILANDFGVDLETIRPKVDNKYQKLDIEYSGLAVYDRLINDSNLGNDLSVVLGKLSDFRNSSVRRAAADRLAASEESIIKTRETISKTGETMRELQAQLKKLREKLNRQKKEIGKEPTKQSAAKILKTESQIDTKNEKLNRSKKRLKNAQRRMAIAEEDAEIARHILNNKEAKKEIKAENMAEDVKPLFDKDPEILDEGIAFKPINFNIPKKTEAVPEKTIMPEPIIKSDSEPIFKSVSDVPSTPLSFIPPIMGNINKENPVEIVPEVKPVPVLETITPIQTEEPIVVPDVNINSVPETTRPVSPISGPEVLKTGHGRPTSLYYLMLVILIVLSVFTLWLYQKKTVNTVPELAVAATKPEMVMEQQNVPAPVIRTAPETVESPFIQAERAEPADVVPVDVPELVQQPEMFVPEQPALAPVFEAEEQEVPEQVQQPIYNDESENMVYDEPEIIEESAVESIPRMNVNKPIYNVSGEKRFIADENYETDSPENQEYNNGQDGYSE